MKIVFRLNYHTVPGQSLWLKLTTLLDGGNLRLAQVLPLHWLNDHQWEVTMNVQSGGPLLLEYS